MAALVIATHSIQFLEERLAAAQCPCFPRVLRPLAGHLHRRCDPCRLNGSQRQMESAKQRPKRVALVPLQQSVAATTVLSMRTPSGPRNSAVGVARRFLMISHKNMTFSRFSGVFCGASGAHPRRIRRPATYACPMSGAPNPHLMRYRPPGGTRGAQGSNPRGVNVAQRLG
jgi:hypothetical protein